VQKKIKKPNKKRLKNKMKLNVLSIDGSTKSDIELSDSIFSLKPNKAIIQSLIDWQMTRFKARTAKTKQRNEVKGSTAKIYAQKGTGGARHSSRKAPLFVGGGIAHGPKGAVYAKKKMNKKVKKLGLLHLLSQKNKVNSLYVVDDFKKEIKKTKLFNEFLIKFKIKNTLIISDKDSRDKIIKSVKNIPNIKIVDTKGANAYDLLKYKNVLFTTTSIKLLQERLVNEKI